MKVVPPPDFSILQQEFIQHFTSVMQKVGESLALGKIVDDLPFLQINDYSEFSVTDKKGRYLHWDKFRRIHTTDTRMKWRAVKESRMKIQKPLSFPLSYRFWFCIPDSLQAKLHLIDKNGGSSVGTSSTHGFSQTEQNRFLLKSLIMEEAITSAQLEGAATTRKVAKDMLRSKRKPKTKDEIMIVNNYRLMQKAVELKDHDLTMETILYLHRIATENAIDNQAASGAFRSSDDIFIADQDGNCIFQPPPHGEVATLMRALCEFANTEHDSIQEQFIHPVVKAVILHFLVGYIHPFGDGNGRTARALFYWFMLKKGYWLFEYLSISRLLKKAPVKYAQSYLYSETDGLDMTYFIYYQAEIIIRTIHDLNQYIIDKQKQMQDFTARIANYTQGLNHRQMGILQKALAESGKIFTAQEVAQEYGISLNTARGDLQKLNQMDLLVQFKSGNAIEYISPQNLLSRLENLKS
ncbi:Fic family protein [Wielerella bovis]|nr:Fic family protein [Wielerella bovis]ULJ59877.1 Fic family protein [Wielerella bovis]